MTRAEVFARARASHERRCADQERAIETRLLLEGFDSDEVEEALRAVREMNTAALRDCRRQVRLELDEVCGDPPPRCPTTRDSRAT